MLSGKYFQKIYNLVLYLTNKNGHTAREVAAYLDCDIRTAQRTLNELEFYFDTSYKKDNTIRPPRYRIDDQRFRRNIVFTEEELLSLQKAVKLLKQKKLDDDYKILDAMQEKIRIKNENQHEDDLDSLYKAEGVIHSPAPHKEIKEEVIRIIRNAIKGCNPIKIMYQSKHSDEVKPCVLCPYGILYGDQNHYLLAKHLNPTKNLGTNDIFYFILSNIHEIEILQDEMFTMDENFSIEEYTKNHFGMWHEEPFECEWLFSQKAAREAKQFTFHTPQEMIENLDGTLTVKFTAGGVREMEWFLHTWGDEVKVIKPEDFAERLKKSAPIRY